MKYTIFESSKYKRQVKKLNKQGKSMDKLASIITKLADDIALDPQNRDHALTGDWVGFRECHIEPDWLLIYQKDGVSLVLTLTQTGSHSELFDENLLIEHIVNIWENDKDLKRQYIDEVWNILTAAYEPIGGCNCDREELFNDNIYWKLTRRNNKITAICVYKLTPYGRKLFLLAAEASPEGKADIRKMMEEDAKFDDRHFYAEVSEAPEYMYIKRGAKQIPVSTAQEILGQSKPIVSTGEDEYHYTRAIGPEKKIMRKVMVGNPKNPDDV